MAPATATTATSGAASSWSATSGAIGGQPISSTCPCPAGRRPSGAPAEWRPATCWTASVPRCRGTSPR
jgi:hypothetical protein